MKEFNAWLEILVIFQSILEFSICKSKGELNFFFFIYFYFIIYTYTYNIKLEMI